MKSLPKHNGGLAFLCFMKDVVFFDCWCQASLVKTTWFIFLERLFRYLWPLKGCPEAPCAFLCSSRSGCWNARTHSGNFFVVWFDCGWTKWNITIFYSLWLTLLSHRLQRHTQSDLLSQYKSNCTIIWLPLYWTGSITGNAGWCKEQ